MKKRIAAMVLMVCLAFTFMPVDKVDAGSKKSLNNKKIYYIHHYSYNGCVLYANIYMMRRTAILKGANWHKIKISSARRKLCTGGNSMAWKYKYKAGGYTYIGRHGYLPGGYKKNKAKLKKLLKKHPEGIVVHGYDRYTSHGVLITEYKHGTFYAVDSAQNKGGRHAGVRKFSKCSLNSLGGCFQYWYLKKVKK